MLVDVEADTYNMNVGLVEGALTPRTKAIMPVHMNGHAVDTDPLMDIAELQRVKFVMKGGRIIRNDLTQYAAPSR